MKFEKKYFFIPKRFFKEKVYISHICDLEALLTKFFFLILTLLSKSSKVRLGFQGYGFGVSRGLFLTAGHGGRSGRGATRLSGRGQRMGQHQDGASMVATVGGAAGGQHGQGRVLPKLRVERWQPARISSGTLPHLRQRTLGRVGRRGEDQ
jgi:hypothetical protein